MYALPLGDQLTLPNPTGRQFDFRFREAPVGPGNGINALTADSEHLRDLRYADEVVHATRS